MSNFFKKYIMRIKESVLRDTLNKSRLLGQLEALISVRPWIPEQDYHKSVSKIVKQVEKINKKREIHEEIIVSNVSFLKLQCKC